MADNRQKILIVDDEPLMQVFIAQILAQQENYVMLAATSGSEALEKLSTFNPDIILLDIRMEGIDGYEVCRQVRTNDRYRFTKIIMVSGCASVDERLRAYDAGADDYITKPFDEQEFLAKVKVHSRLKHKEEVDQVKGDLLNLLTHETMTPLNGIMGCGEILLADPALHDKHRELVEMIVGEGAQLNRFIQNALLLSKLKAGLDLTFSYEPVVALLEEIVAECASLQSAQDVHYAVSGDEKLQFEADWPLLRFALLSIIGNAGKFSPQGGMVAVSVETEQEHCQIIIDDQGRGLDPGHKTRIFEEFSVYDLAHHQRGQGLSLAISRRICSCHGGDIIVQDNPAGKGSRFIVRIPMRKG